MTSVTEGARTAPAARLAALRGNCLGASVLLIAQFALGTAVSLYVTLTGHRAFFPAVSGSALLAAHAIVGVLLLGAATGALVRAIRTRTAMLLTSAGLTAVLAAGAAGAVFVAGQAVAASLSMALATTVATLSYLVAVFRLS